MLFIDFVPDTFHWHALLWITVQYYRESNTPIYDYVINAYILLSFLLGEFTDDRWIILKLASIAELWWFLGCK